MGKGVEMIFFFVVVVFALIKMMMMKKKKWWERASFSPLMDEIGFELAAISFIQPLSRKMYDMNGVFLFPSLLLL